jgi:tRNA 2-(methylsulfanyl)-N6-isopentenyladenosine37 hydroxylase
MLGLKLPTDPRWVNIVEKNIEEILTDHAYCEQKAVTNAISIIVSFPDQTELVDEMLSLAKEELIHFEMVHEKLKARGLKLGKERKDHYVGEIYKFMRKGWDNRNVVMVERLLFSAIVEARSCERFKLLSEQIQDRDLAAFYRALMISEANHYTMFLSLARRLAKDIDVEKRWQEFLAFEAEVIAKYGVSETMHG